DIQRRNAETGATWNIDHLVIGPSGVYVIETKHRTKGDPKDKIHFDGNTVRIGNARPTTDPIDQVRRNVRDVRAMLDKAGMRDVPVRGVVCYPGWWVEQAPGADASDVRVLNPKQMFQRLEHVE